MAQRLFWRWQYSMQKWEEPSLTALEHPYPAWFQLIKAGAAWAQSGMNGALARFSYLEEAGGVAPSGLKALTGSVPPCWDSMAFWISVTKAGSSG